MRAGLADWMQIEAEGPAQAFYRPREIAQVVTTPTQIIRHRCPFCCSFRCVLEERESVLGSIKFIENYAALAFYVLQTVLMLGEMK